MERHSISQPSETGRIRAAVRAVAATTLLVALLTVPALTLFRLLSSQQTVSTVSALALLATWTLLMIGLGVEIAEATAARRGRSTGRNGVGGPLGVLARWIVGSLVAGWGLLGLGGPAAATPPRALPPSASALPATPAESIAPTGTAAEDHVSDSAPSANAAPATKPPNRLHRAQHGLQAPRTPAAAQQNPAQDAPPEAPAGPRQQPDATTTVLPGENFWELAERELIQAWGRDPTDSEVARYWVDYIEANRHRLMPPGDPNLIYPGQVFTAPAAPTDATGQANPTATPPPAPSPPADPPNDGAGASDGTSGGESTTENESPPQPEGAPGGNAETPGGLPGHSEEPILDEEPVGDQNQSADQTASETPAEPGAAASEPDSPTDQSGAEPPSTEPDSPTAPDSSSQPATAVSSSPAQGDDTDESSGGSQSSRLPLLAAGGVILGGILLWLRRQRSAQQRTRRTGERPRHPAPELQAAEEELVDGATEDAVQRVDAVLRAAAAGTGSRGLPPIRWVESSPEATMLVLEEPWASSAPAGFRPLDGTTWLTTSPTEDLEDLGEAMAAPVSTLVAVGATGEHSEALIDLEASGVTTLDGPVEQAPDLLRAVAVAVATSPWSERSRVILVGLGGELTDLPWVTQAGLDAALDVAEGHLSQVSAALQGGGFDGTPQARAVSSRSHAWDPVVVVSATRPQRPDQLRRLQTLAEHPHQGVAVVTLAPAHPDGGGPPPRVGRLLALQDDESLQVDGIDEVIWPRLLDEASTSGLVRLLSQAELRDAEAYQARQMTQRSSPEPAPGGEPTPPDGEPGPLRLGVDELLNDVEVVVRLLGDVEAVRHPGMPSEQKLIPPRHKALELLAYLASRQEPVPAEELRHKLFPTDDNPAQALSRAVSAARSLVGDELLQAQPDGAYVVPPSVTTDYGLFAELAAQAEETEDAHRAAWLLTEALDLVRGEPFGGLGRRYGWAGPHRGGLTAEIVDAAEELAEVRLALGDWRSADWAARQGLHVAPNDERLYRLLMRATVAAGNGPPAVLQLFEELCDAIRQTEHVRRPEDVLSPDTVQLFHDLAGDQAALAPAAH